jgi:signal transduction histidine kinase
VPGCVLLDYSLPGRHGIEVLKRIRPNHPHLPVILLTGQGNEAIAVQAMKEGAQDYIIKTSITAETLARVIRNALETSALQKRVHEQHVALEIFTQALAHDLKEPVRTVCSFTQLILDGRGDCSGEYLRFIRDAGERMALLIESVFSYTQLDGLGPLEVDTLDLTEAVRAAKDNLYALFRERGTTLSADQLPSVCANRIQIIQVLQNLMANAADHSVKPVHIRIGASPVGSMLRVFVQDDGPGIPSEHQGQIFEPFRRLNRDNAHCGLGLAICRKIIERHGGKLYCDSSIGAGTTFSFTLPGAVAWQSESSAEAPAVDRLGNEAGESSIANVLLVDDRDDDVSFTRAVLSGPRGVRCNLLVAHDGAAGLTTIRDHLNKGNPIDLVLLDINMPIMNGFQMLEAMGKDDALARIPVVTCSGSAREKDKERSRALGAIGYVIKPALFDHLRPIIVRATRLRVTEDAAGRSVLTRA